MNRHVIGLALLLGAALVATQTWADDAANRNKARADVLDVVKDLEAGKDVEAKVAAIREKYEDLEHLMAVYNSRDRGGLGIGPKAARADGIEFKIVTLAKKALSPARLAKEKAELIRMAYLNIAMARIAHRFVGKRKPREWKEAAEDTEKASRQLLQALRQDHADGVKKAAAKLTSTCNGCHGYCEH